MQVALVSVHNGFGLSRDLRLLDKLLQSAAINTSIVDVRDPQPYCADLNIFLEVIDPRLFPRARRQIVFPNPEWWRDEWSAYLPQLYVLAKTRHTERVFRSLGARVSFTGFMFEDRCLPELKKENTFLHVAGQSQGRFTRRIINEWLCHPEWPTLNVTGAKFRKSKPTSNVHVYGGFIEDATLRLLQNRSRFQICTSRYEGFGHCFWEALSCGSVVLACNAPPTDEILGDGVGIAVPATITRRGMGLVELCDASRSSIRDSVEAALSATSEQLEVWCRKARDAAVGMLEGARDRITKEISSELWPEG